MFTYCVEDFENYRPYDCYDYMDLLIECYINFDDIFNQERLIKITRNNVLRGSGTTEFISQLLVPKNTKKLSIEDRLQYDLVNDVELRYKESGDKHCWSYSNSFFNYVREIDISLQLEILKSYLTIEHDLFFDGNKVER